MTAPAPRLCPQGHEVAEGLAFCESCGAPVTESAAGPASPASGSRRTWIIVAAGAAAVVVAAVIVLLVVRGATSAPEVTVQSARSLLEEGGITCAEYSSLDAGEGTPEGDLLNATLVSCDVEGANGDKDVEASVALIISDSPESLDSFLTVSGLCESEGNLDDVLAVGGNWIGSGQGSDASPVVAQRIADALGGEVTTAGELLAGVCESR